MADPCELIVVSSINKPPRKDFLATNAEIISLLLREAILAEDTVAVKDKLSSILEAVLAFVPMLRVLVHHQGNPTNMSLNCSYT